MPSASCCQHVRPANPQRPQLDAMGVYSTSWASGLLLEANRFWFYSLCFSLVLAVLQLSQLYFETPIPEGEEKISRNGKSINVVESDKKDSVEVKKWRFRRERIVKKALTDACDILIPGSMLGWVLVSSGTVGMATVVSTVLASGDIWDRVQ